MKVLLDENIPLRFYHRLREANHDVEHVTLGRRGISDGEIIQRLTAEPELVLFTQDKDFENVRIVPGGKVVISRVSQSIPIDDRVRIWLTAMETFLKSPPDGALFEVGATGEVVRLPE